MVVALMINLLFSRKSMHKLYVAVEVYSSKAKFLGLKGSLPCRNLAKANGNKVPY